MKYTSGNDFQYITVLFKILYGSDNWVLKSNRIRAIFVRIYLLNVIIQPYQRHLYESIVKISKSNHMRETYADGRTITKNSEPFI